jgi:phosphocarrier protein HPr
MAKLPRGPAVRRELAIVDSLGLHARATAKFVKCAERYDAEIQVSRDGQTVPATSMLGLLMLAAHCGTTIDVTASGPEADEALAALANLVASKFGEE